MLCKSQKDVEIQSLQSDLRQQKIEAEDNIGSLTEQLRTANVDLQKFQEEITHYQVTKITCIVGQHQSF